MNPPKVLKLHVITVLITVLSFLTTLTGLFYTTGGKTYTVTNQYGDIVRIYGDGLYAHDSYFMAPIFRGTDFTILCVALPLLILSLVLDMKKQTLKSRLFLTSVISIFTYYSASIAFGVTYNFLQLIYIMLFSLSFFGLILAIRSINSSLLIKSMERTLPQVGIRIFLVLSGIALIVAWLPDIIVSLIHSQSLQLIEVYTTQITYVLDMGVIGPTALICLFMLKKKNGMGYILLAILLTVCTLVGIMLPIQTIFQLSANIEIPIGAVITKIGSFVALASFALYFDIRLFKSIENSLTLYDRKCIE
ncbi:hypothetical protein acsn021_38950 [Anaerocolumna cellulosilytica]|uniref:Uncharacterized protein n=1 Tax=Anaerocolumna cellulosilytica TaxID=433286 RepID=A0A6S6R2G2_9FIRM|nr:hypothetical protein [Anaerocolumna cellulosilytica]MBB5196295.1 hypothetical protein [Anaerocolumna cellulosilytica]BCJ96326.1 hypothetical protein acsn021_38950 [Anaerocolumna cellulosilytica]